MISQFLNNPDYSYEKMNKASLACGPLVKWAIAQVSYADMLQKVDPLREELTNNENAMLANKSKLTAVADMINELEGHIAKYKEEYAALISEAQAIKTDLSTVEAKVTRSTALLRSLGSERQRWEETSEGFQNQMGTIAGDVLLSAALSLIHI